MASFHERLAELREAEGLKKKDFAKILHVSAGTISNYESGRHTPDMNTLIAIAEYFQVSVDYLLGLTSRKSIILYGGRVCDRYAAGAACGKTHGAVSGVPRVH